MIKKKELKNMINHIDLLIKEVNQKNGPIYSTTLILNRTILMLGKRPKIVPTMSMENLPEEDKFLDLSNVTLRNCCIGDLILIKSMLIGVFNNFANYKNESKIIEFTQDTIVKLAPIAIQSLNQLYKIL